METSLIGRVRLVIKLLVVEHLSRPWNILYNIEGFIACAGIKSDII